MSKAFLLSERFEFDSEVSHQLRLPFDSDTPSDFMPTVIYILQCRCNDIHMIVSVSAPAYAETQKIIAIKTIFTCDRITVRKQIPDLTPSDTCFPIQFDSETLSRELLFRYPVKHLVGIDKKRMSSYRTLIRYPVFIKFGGEILNLFDTGLKHFEFGIFVKTDSECAISRPFIPP